ncbi:hypothetical protein FA13DRAFT_1774490 [Coprinellus micaceus]|uniref:REJ domain-containing protein n=1 Tax=Coprinellus micaceus TaxID=71717 RepID=A0A4Y7TA70_COPMI|nr:hypothetical protein FA13DRAFT_1774490 [Coprinellus micaceus]
MSYTTRHAQERVYFLETNRRRLALSMIHCYDVLTEMFVRRKTETAPSERGMNVSRIRLVSPELSTREEHSSRKRRTSCAPDGSSSLLVPWWGSRGCSSAKLKTQKRSAGGFNGGKATTFTLSSPRSSCTDVTTSASTRGETDGADTLPTARHSSSSCSSTTHSSYPFPTSTSTTGYVLYPCRLPQTMDSDTVTSTITTPVTGTQTTTISSPTTITLTQGEPSSTTTSGVLTITLTSASTPTRSEPSSSSTGSEGIPSPTSSNSPSGSSTGAPATQTGPDTETATSSSIYTFTPDPESETPSSSTSPTATLPPTTSISPSSESETISTSLISSSESPEETSTTSEASSSTTLIPSPMPVTSSTVRPASRVSTPAPRTRTITRSTLSTSTFTSVVTSTFTDGTSTTTFTSTTVIETGVLATDIADPTGFAMNGPGIIGVSIGSAVGLLLLVLCLFFCIRRLHRRATPSGSPNNSSTSVVGPGNGGWSPPLRDDDEKHMRLISNRMKGLYGAATAAFSHLNIASSASARNGRQGGDDMEKGLSRDVSTRSGAASDESTAVGHTPAPPSYGHASRIVSRSDEKDVTDSQAKAKIHRSLGPTVGVGTSGDDQVLGASRAASVRKHNSLYGPRPYPGSGRTTRRYSSTPTSLTQHLESTQAERAVHPELSGVSEFGEIPLPEETKQGSQKGSQWYRLSSNGKRPDIPNPFSTARSSSESLKDTLEIPSMIPFSMASDAGPSASMRPPSAFLSPSRPIAHTPIVIDTNSGSIRSIPPPILTFPRSITGNSYTSTSSKNPFIPAAPPSPAFSQDTITDDASSFRKEGLLNPGMVSGLGSPSSPRIEQANSIASLRDHLDYSRPIGSGLVNVVERHDSINTLGSLGSVKEEGKEGKDYPKEKGKEAERT